MQDPLTVGVHTLLAVDTRRCAVGDSCQGALLMFDMTSLTNTWNISGIETDFIAWKPDHNVPNVTASTPPTTSYSTPPPNSTQPPHPTSTPEFTPISHSLTPFAIKETMYQFLCRLPYFA